MCSFLSISSTHARDTYASRAKVLSRHSRINFEFWVCAADADTPLRCHSMLALELVSASFLQQQRGFISQGSCAQAILALLIVVQRQTGNGGCVFACFVDIRKAFPRVRREISFHKMHKLGIPLVYIRSIMALYIVISRGRPKADGFSPTFPIAQGTREGSILSPLLFLIFSRMPCECLKELSLMRVPLCWARYL